MAVFCSSLTSWFPGMLLTYFLNDFEMVPVAPIITGITFVFTFYMRCISIVRSLYFRIFSASFLITFLSPGIATFIIIIIIIIISEIPKITFLFTGLLTQEDLVAVLNNVLFIYLFAYVGASSSDCIASNDRMMLNWKECGR